VQTLLLKLSPLKTKTPAGEAGAFLFRGHDPPEAGSGRGCRRHDPETHLQFRFAGLGAGARSACADHGRRQGNSKMKMRKFVKKFLKAADVAEGPLVRHIVDVKEGNYGAEVAFASGEILSLSTTNVITLCGAYGDESADWIGKEVELYEGQTEVAARDEHGDPLRDADGKLTGEKKTVTMILIRPITPPIVNTAMLEERAAAREAGNGMDDYIPL
jgi:hypothetical protein